MKSNSNIIFCPTDIARDAQNNPLYFGTSTFLSSTGSNFSGSYPGRTATHASLGGGVWTVNENNDGYMSLDTVGTTSFTSRDALLSQSSQCKTFEEEHIYDHIDFPGLSEKDAAMQESEVTLEDGQNVMVPSSDDDLKMKPIPLSAGKHDKCKTNPQEQAFSEAQFNPYVMEPSTS